MRLVVKVGTSLLTNEDHRLNAGFLKMFIEQMALLRKQGHEVIVVSSGAVAAGRSEVSFDREKKNIPYRQALAAVGQGILMKMYHDSFRAHGLSIAQALLTNYDFVNRENFLNTRNVFDVLLTKGVIPIVNENDVTTVAELKFGDNDMLSAKTAAMVSADYLFIFTDVDGLFEEDPRKNPNAKLLPVVKKIDASVRKRAGGARSKASMGGMATKIEAADYVTSVGIPMFIVNGRRENLLMKLKEFCRHAAKSGVSGKMQQAELPPVFRELGTFFPSLVDRMESQKKWLKPKILKNAWIEVDAGAAQALTSLGKSLLPSGVSGVRGEFHRGDVILVKGPGGEVGYGQVNYDSGDIDKIKKCHSSEIEMILGFSFEDEIIHRDRMVILH